MHEFLLQGVAVLGVCLVMFILVLFAGWVHDWRLEIAAKRINDLEELRAPSIEIRAPFPHCDSDVLHKPGECIYCDNYPDYQSARIRDHVNFTGHTDHDLKPCPSTLRRALEQIERWPGNRAYPE